MYDNSSTVSPEYLARQRAARAAARRKRIRNRRIFVACVVVVALLLVVLILTAFTKPGDKAPDVGTGCNGNCKGQQVFIIPDGMNGDSGNSNSAVITNVSLDKKPVEKQKIYTDRDVELIAKTVYGEALVTQSDTEMAAVVWCILNRVDVKDYACGNSIEYVVTFPKQFHGYDPDNPVTPHIKELVIDVLDRWQAEKEGAKDVGRILPKEYRFFEGDGRHNHYVTSYGGKDYWDWSLESPYES